LEGFGEQASLYFSQHTTKITSVIIKW